MSTHPRRIRKNQNASQQHSSNDDRPYAAGFVRQVHLINFLTHDNLVVQFIPKINFINGANGSGKSAVLASIMIGLGGRANHTGRGQNITNLIQDNKASCSITVELSNQGEDAYLPETYGETISITRKILRAGRSTYSIRNHDGTEISKLRRDLASITDHFNIQVDNTLTWLTQDLAKEFLMNVKDSELYKFFAVGADIIETRDTYRVIGEQIVDLCDKIKILTNSLDTLKQKRSDLKTVQRELQAVDEIEHQLAALSNELNWCQINEMEAVMHQLLDKRSTEYAAINQTVENSKQLQLQLESAHEKVNQAQLDAQSHFDANDLVANEKLLVSAKMKRTQAIQDFESIKAETADTQSQLNRANSKLREMEQRLSHDGLQVRKQNLDRLDSLRQKVNQSALRIKEIDVLVAQLNQHDLQAIRTRREALQSKHAEVSSQSTNLGNRITAVEQASINHVNTWGNQMVALLDAIDQTSWHGDKPLGPLGRYVVPSEKHRGTWLQYLRGTVGPAMFDFVVSNVDDRKTLQSLFNRFQQRNSRIIITNMNQELELNGYLPDSRFLTALDILEISNPTIERVLIVNLQIEQRILVEDRRDAEHITQHGFPPNSIGVFLPNGYRVGTQTGALGMTSGAKWTGAMCPFGLKMSSRSSGTRGEDPAGDHDLDQMRARLNLMKRDQALIEAELQTTDAAYIEKQATMQNLQQERGTLDRQSRIQSRELTTLEESILVEEPLELATAQDTIQELTESLNTYEMQLPAAQQCVDSTTADVCAMESRIADLKKMRDQAKNYAATKQQAIQTAKRHVRELETEIQANQQVIAQHTNMIEMVNVQIDQQQAQLDQATGTTERVRPQSDRPRDSPVRTRDEILAIQRAKQLQVDAIRDRHAGTTLQQATDRADRAKDDYVRAKTELVHLQTVVNRLRTTLHARATSFSMLVMSVSRLATHAFRQHMKTRGFAADLTFDHDRMLLSVTADALDDNATRAIKTYSGGEKSFSTVCLLLALWDAIPSPIRALDEFDVFQDDVMRRMTMDLLIDAAKGSESQFIFITPLNLENLAKHDDPDVRIVWLPEPLRNNVASA